MDSYSCYTGGCTIVDYYVQLRSETDFIFIYNRTFRVLQGEHFAGAGWPEMKIERHLFRAVTAGPRKPET